MANPFDQPNGNVVSDDRKIWWLASYPKSGNTWVRMFLNCYATRFPVNLNSAYQFVTSDLKPEIYQMMSPRPLSEMSIREQFMYHQGALINMIKLANTQNICVKTHNAKANIDGVALIPPVLTGGAVYIMRDPRDVVLSMAEHFTLPIAKAIGQLADDSRAGLSKQNLHHMFMSWSSHVKSWTFGNKDVDTLIIKYEDINKESLASIVKFMGLADVEDYEERLAFATKETQFSVLAAAEEKTGFVEKAGGEKFFRVGKSGQWRDKLSRNEIKSIENQHKDVMIKYGYL